MSADALGSPEVSLLRRRVPEFESTFQDEVREEDGELGAFQAMSILGDWVRDRLDAGRDDDAVQRAFDAVEAIITDDRYPLGDALAAEFIEAVWDHPQAVALMGSTTRKRAQPG